MCVHDKQMTDVLSTKRRREEDESIPGLRLVCDFLTLEEEQRVIDHIYSGQWNTALTRRTQHYGHTYDYTNKNVLAKDVVTPPIPDWCTFIIDRLMDQGVLETVPDQLIVNEYQPGQGIHAHVDNVASFADGIVSISLCSDIVMDFIPGDGKGEKVELSLPKRSLLSLHGDARYKWRHGISARKSDHGKPRRRRVSLTFRKLK